jgi:hypothetical protein
MRRDTSDDKPVDFSFQPGRTQPIMSEQTMTTVWNYPEDSQEHVRAGPEVFRKVLRQL